MIGEKFGRLTVVEHKGVVHGHRIVLCACQCGQMKKVRVEALRRRAVRSCGCLFVDTHTTHGRSPRCSRNSVFRSWEQMRDRCRNPNNHSYHRYGGRGITICERWEVFQAFLADMGERPKGTSLDRIDNDGNYEPGNCRWATRKQQANNTCKSVRFTFNGHTKTVAEWADCLAMPVATLHARIRKGWPVERALTQLVDKRYARNRRCATN